MRYYGMSNQNGSMPQNPPMNSQASDYPTNMDNDMEAVPKTSESQTFNRPNQASGVYQGQRAQNVRPVEDWSESFPPAVMPPDSNPSAMGMENTTIYEYPAPQWQGEPPMGNSCPSNVSTVSYLCSQKGKILRVELGNGISRSGVLKAINESYIILEERPSGNQIMCNLKAVKSIDVFM